MTQKNCENEIRELNRDQQEMLDEHIDRLNKVFKGKDNYAGIAVMSEKYAPVVSALITLDTEKQMDERFWNHLRVQRNILNFLYALWLDDDRTLVDEFSTIMKDLVEYDFEITDKNMKQELNIA